MIVAVYFYCLSNITIKKHKNDFNIHMLKQIDKNRFEKNLKNKNERGKHCQKL